MRSYIDIVRESVKRNDCESFIQKAEMKKHEEDEHALREFPTTHNNDLRRHAPSRRPPIPRYQSFFSSLCYACSNYGHKDIDCRTYECNRNTWSINSHENYRYQFESNVSESRMEPLIEITTNLEH